MKRFFIPGLFLIVLAAGTWIGRTAWRAHHDLVTLRVRNMPLAEVITRLQRQTRETIVADGRLDERVTLTLKNVPLREALDRVGTQVGAMATAIHAVHRSPLSDLFVGLRAGEAFPAEGWTTLAPRLNMMEARHESPADGGASVTFGGRDEVKEGRIEVNEDIRDLDGPGPGQPVQIRGVRRHEGGRIHEEIITPEKIVIETDLEPELGVDAMLSPDRGTARKLARQVGAQCTTFYTLHKSAVAEFAGGMLRELRVESEPRDATRSGGKPPGQPLEAAELDARREQLRHYTDLTPEQRARRARERQEQSSQP